MTKNLFIDIIARDKSKRALTAVQTKLGEVRNRVFSLRSAFLGLGAGLVVKSFVDVGKEVESLNIRFKFLFGSAEEGAKAFDNLAKFAGTVPFSLEEISRASGNLAVVAKDADDLNRVLEITGNVAAVTGLDFETASSQIQRAFAGGIGAADLFRERGVRALLGFEAGAKVTAEETVRRFEELFSGDGRFAGATKDLATTLEGTISMLGDKFFNFQKDVAEGFFDELKGEFGDLNKFLGENEQQIEDIARAIGENFAGAVTKTSNVIKGVAPAVKSVSQALGTTIDGFKSLPTFVQEAGIVSVLLFGKKGLVAFGAISFLLGELKEILDQAEKSNNLDALFEGFKTGEIDAATLSLKELNEILGVLEAQGTVKSGAKDLREERIETIINLIAIQTRRQELLNKTIAQGSIVGSEFGKAFGQVGEVIEEVNEKTKKAVSLQQMLNDSIADLTKKGAEDLLRIREEYNPLFAIQNQQEEEIKELNNAYNRKLLDFEEYQILRNQIEEKYSKTRTDKAFELLKDGRLKELDFEKLSQKERMDILTGAGRDILGNLSSFNKKAFRLNQSLAIGDAIVSTAQGIMAGLKKGFPIGYIEAAITAARGAAQIAAIRSAPAPRIAGGRVNAGQPYMVGEGGSEMFVPQQSGTIVPNNQLAGTNVNITIMANDTEGFDELLSRRRATVVNIINDALNSQGKEAII
jgi:hypothetical protein|tara:strand:+ start:37 stop:2124 length:2088 start_codon:yes stop_codon:yes gene_type:complete